MIRAILFIQEVRETFSVHIRLAKFYLCLLIGGSAVFGYALAASSFSFDMVLVGGGLLILATGAATLNSLQEYRLDGQLERTRQRPLPQGRITPGRAGLQASVLLVSGLVVLYFSTGTLLAFFTAVLAVLLYNGIYTPLKQKTVLAILPGAVCGALPPYIGWLAGGGEGTGYPALLILALFFLWQIPHFWLVMLSFKKDYTASALPSLLEEFGEAALNRFMVTWIGAMAVVMLIFTTLPLSSLFRLAVTLNSGLMLLFMIYGLLLCRHPNYRRQFILLNFFFLLHMLFVTLGSCLR